LPPGKRPRAALSGREGSHYRAQLPTITLIVEARAERGASRATSLRDPVFATRSVTQSRLITEFRSTFARRGFTGAKAMGVKYRPRQITPRAV